MNGSRLPKKSTLLIWPHKILRLLTIISFVILHRGSCVMGCGSSLPFRSICNCYVFPRDIMNWQSWHGHHIYFVLLSRVSNSMQSARYCFYHFCLSVSLSVRHICGNDCTYRQIFCTVWLYCLVFWATTIITKFQGNSLSRTLSTWGRKFCFAIFYRNRSWSQKRLR